MRRIYTGQGFSHGLLRQQLEYYAAELDLDLLDHKSVIFFRLRTDDNGADAVPARVYVEKTVGGNAEMFDSDEIITQAKRNTRANSSIMGPGLAIEEIRARIAAGRGYEVLLHENMTVCFIFLLCSVEPCATYWAQQSLCSESLVADDQFLEHRLPILTWRVDRCVNATSGACLSHRCPLNGVWQTLTAMRQLPVTCQRVQNISLTVENGVEQHPSPQIPHCNSWKLLV